MTSNSVSVTSQTLASVACYLSKQVDFSKLTVGELSAKSSTKCKHDFFDISYLCNLYYRFSHLGTIFILRKGVLRLF